MHVALCLFPLLVFFFFGKIERLVVEPPLSIQDMETQKHEVSKICWDGKQWMAQQWRTLAHRKITDIILPGSHDSATSRLTNEIANDDGGNKIRQLRRFFGTNITDSVAGKWSKCQTLSIAHQLQLGVRFLDLRVGFDASKRLPEALRCCHGFFGECIAEVLMQVRAFCEEHLQEFVVLDFAHLHFNTRAEPHTPCDDLNDSDDLHACLVRQIELVLGPFLVSRRDWLLPLKDLLPGGHRIFLFYNGFHLANSSSVTWQREWLLQRHSVDTRWPRVPRVEELKEKLDEFVRDHSHRRRRIAAGELGEGEERLFVLQGVVTEEACQVVAGIVSSAFCCMLRGAVKCARCPNSIQEQSEVVNPVVLRLVEEEYIPSSLNVILLDWYYEAEAASRIASLNLKPRTSV